MMVFTSIYSVVDGLFVSNFVGKTSFAAVNFIMPLLSIMGTPGFMIGTGGSAIVAKTLGEGEPEKANSRFSLLMYTALVIGALFTAIGMLILRPAASLMGAEGELLEDCVLYGRVYLLGLTGFMLQNAFQSFCICAEKPKMGLAVIVMAGVTNMVLDALFVGLFRWGLAGAAAATAISQFIGGFVPFIYFCRPNNSLLRLKKAYFDGAVLLKTCTNGSSELMSNISMSLVGMLYNIQLLKYIGEDGISAYGVIMYLNFTFLSMYIGYSIGTAPIFSYHFGAKNSRELHNLLKKSIVMVLAASLAMTVSAELLAHPLSELFVGYDAELFNLTVRGFRIFSFMFLFAGMGIFGSGFFTALNDGLTSALISFLRTLVFQVGAVLLLPLVLGIDGIWLSIVVAEGLSLCVTIFFLAARRDKYRYFG